MITRQAIAGSVYGLALGDTLGYQTEFKQLQTIHRLFGTSGHMRFPQPAYFSDDTQMTLAIARALNNMRSVNSRELARTVTNEFIRWARYEPSRAPGSSCLASIRNLERNRCGYKKSWTVAPVMSFGCGANMRVVPTALYPDFDIAMGMTQQQAALTHAQPLAIASAELTAVAVRYASEGIALTDLPDALCDYARTQHGIYRHTWLGPLHERWTGNRYNNMTDSWLQLENITLNVMRALRRRPFDVCASLGESWVAHEAYATGLYHAVQFGEDPMLAISMAARTNGDSDSIACITGAIVGATARSDTFWPPALVRQLERLNDLNHCIDTIHARIQAVTV